MVFLGDPKRRSCDACESFGALVKKSIKHLTCRRRIKEEATDHTRRLAGGANGKKWRQTFNRGYIEQAFRRVTVSEGLHHGKENEPYMQCADHRRLATGKTHYEARKFDVSSPACTTVRLAIEAAQAAAKS